MNEHIFDNHHFPMAESENKGQDDDHCEKCGAGNNAHRVERMQGTITRTCVICGKQSYIILREKPSQFGRTPAKPHHP